MANAWIIPPVAFTATSDSTAMGSPGNMALDYAGIVWRSTTAAAPSVRFDLGADTAVDTVALFGLVGTLTGATYQVFGSTSSEGAGARARASQVMSLLAGSVLPVSGQGVALAALPAGWPPIRFIDIQFALPANVQVSRAVIGSRIVLGRNFSYGGSFGVRDLGSLDFSARGVLLRRRAKKLRTTALTFSNIRKDEVESSTKPLLERIGNTEMIALFTDPSPDAQLMNRAYFGPLVGDLAHVWRNAAAWEAKANLVSVF